ncbi:GDSL esterase/lipase At5g45950-like [Ananas comosus]|uniref:GDSL esterase/lipase At5g45950-like n=1 Tax=Ananas comosus TaxID=4615 RepID=A0A6P5EGZ1_ANACO|nr:GDSL esterase/lipase At5g45950-like [Ananas comosus]
MAEFKAIVNFLMFMLCQLCALAAALEHSPAAAVPRMPNGTCLLVFGDSTVDPGNNNRLPTTAKANFSPYGRDFFNHTPTGRFCDGRLATDIFSEKVGSTKVIPAFLDPNLKPEQLKYGVSFASAASGYDELTSTNANVLSFSQQLQNLRNYKTQLTKLVGIGRSKEIIKDAVFVISAGTNDLLQSYLSMNQPNQTMPKYENYLINLTSNYVKVMNELGGTRFVLVGVPPFGCLPIVRTLFGVENCSSELNAVATSFNSKLVTMLGVLKRKLRVRAAYMDIFTIMYEATRNPEKFGLLETSKGCCGSGLTEVGDTCKNQTTCEDPHKYVYWDAVHPTERMYEIVTDYAMITAFREIFG